MKFRLLSILTAISAAAIVVLIVIPGVPFPSSPAPPAALNLPAQPSSSSPRASQAMKKRRWEYFFRLQRDPSTNRIPDNIRARELAYARTLPTQPDLHSKSKARLAFEWSETGPFDVGGRTRALAVDRRDPNVILAGGVSGGIWKSTDGGETWALKSDPAQQLSVTSLAQDPTSPDVWYYTTGEYRGNSASDRGFVAPFRGSGVYQSTDNGETWNVLTPSAAEDPTTYHSPFQYVPRVVVSPTTGTVLLATNAAGAYRSGNDGASFDHVLSAPNGPIWSDVAVAANGTFLATLSSTGVGASGETAGVYLSEDDGRTWTNITPPTFPDIHRRSAIAFAPSNPAVAYAITTTGRVVDEREDTRLHRFDLSGDSATADDRSANLPAFNNSVGSFNTQFNYNLMIAVKPDDPNFVIIGGRNLYRSTDGFSSELSQSHDWIGGYNNASQGFASYPNHHPDQHVVAFDPSNPNRIWSGNDGGVYVTNDIAAADVSWIDKNNGYNVTQFYTAALAQQPNDERVAGGTQDNGTPFFQFNQPSPSSIDISGADGAYLHLGEERAYTSIQGGRIYRLRYNSTGVPNAFDATITPSNASDQLFINPFDVDPASEQIIYYPAGDDLWRTLDEGDTWTELDIPPIGDCVISTVAASRSNPRHVLYYGVSCSNGKPRLFRIDEVQSAAYAITEITIPDGQIPPDANLRGAYVHNIAVHPNDADEFLVVHSNYNVQGLYHSADGGQTYTSVEGSLTGDTNTPGPSLRSATLVPHPGSDHTTYVLGTSTGIYSTSTLDGAATRWKQEASSSLGNAVVEYVTSRPSDLRVAAATHGRGIFIGRASEQPSVVFAGFSSAPGKNSMLVSWETLLERDNEGFELQMRDTDAPESPGAWKHVAFIEGAGAGFTTTTQTYEHRIPFLLPGTYTFRLKQISLDGSTQLFTPDELEATVRVAGSHQLTSAHPNPFSGQTTFSISVSEQQQVQVGVYDVQGRRVQVLYDGELPSHNAHSFHFDARRLASGLYFYRAVGETFTETKRMVLVR